MGTNGDGKCRPCVWNWKPMGCVKGHACKFCHSCGPGQLKINMKKRSGQRRSPDEIVTEPSPGPPSLLDSAMALQGISSWTTSSNSPSCLEQVPHVSPRLPLLGSITN